MLSEIILDSLQKVAEAIRHVSLLHHQILAVANTLLYQVQHTLASCEALEAELCRTPVGREFEECRKLIRRLEHLVLDSGLPKGKALPQKESPQVRSHKSVTFIREDRSEPNVSERCYSQSDSEFSEGYSAQSYYHQ